MLPHFELFGQTFHSYSLATLLSLASGFTLSWAFIRQEGYSFRLYLCICFAIGIGFFVGARLFNVLLNVEYYQKNPTAIIELKLKGFSVCGGAIGAILICVFVLKVVKQNIYRFLDLISGPFFLSFATMKSGCFLNGCCGGKYTNSFIGVVFPKKEVNNVLDTLNFFAGFLSVPKKQYPTQLFEAGAMLLFIPVIIIILKSKTYFAGKAFAISATYFCFARLSVHFFRVFPYNDIIVNIFYPFFYLTLIVVGVLWLGKKGFFCFENLYKK